MTLILFLFFS